MSPDDAPNQPARDGERRRAPSKGSKTGGGAKGARGRRGGGRDDRTKRKRVAPQLRIGIAVEPAEVGDRSSQFRVLEADAGLEVLTDRMVAPWVDRTPDGFSLDVRAHRLLTHHPAPMESIPPDVRDLLPPSVRSGRQVYADDLPAAALELALDRVLASVRPLHEFGKLGALLFAFPSYVVPGSKAFDYFAWLRERAGDLPLAVELRHRTWVDSKHRDETMAFLTEQRLAYVCVDVPSGFPSSLPPLAVATTDTAFVHFHGRNADEWERGADTGDDRFRSDYRRSDLEPWRPRLEKLAAAARAVHVVFTTGRGEAAARDARLLVKTLTEEPEPERPPPPRKNTRGRGGSPYTGRR
ncbi:MAG TPA: DUF72 domain-containing protein [Acidimicrobiia bacterium]|nr:DUF72 domain-containing protein [Acidimicrobiia bacterium]